MGDILPPPDESKWERLGNSVQRIHDFGYKIGIADKDERARIGKGVDWRWWVSLPDTVCPREVGWERVQQAETERETEI